MTQKKRTYQQALADAQKQGFAEANPTLDVSGMDSAHKLAVLSSLAFGIQVDFEQISVEGIDTLKLSDINAAAELGYVVKLLAIGQRDTTASACGSTRPLSEGSSAGKRDRTVQRPEFLRPRGRARVLLWPWRGADANGFRRCVRPCGCRTGQCPAELRESADLADQHPVTPLKPIDNIESRYYVRLMMYDRPGALASVTRILGEHKISLSAVVQHEIPEETTDKTVVPVVIMTHRAAEGNVKEALAEADRTAVVKGRPIRIRVVEEYVEPKC